MLRPLTPLARGSPSSPCRLEELDGADSGLSAPGNATGGPRKPRTARLALVLVDPTGIEPVTS
jgi:hypothetical protein